MKKVGNVHKAMQKPFWGSFSLGHDLSYCHFEVIGRREAKKCKVIDIPVDGRVQQFAPSRGWHHGPGHRTPHTFTYSDQ